ncbi:hypothetical protein PN498_15670 [Oscillatoria sp. CS-180]|uniref:hypothetical protein n=1 Tax=Oscillatoria sp. CS-180 TaxID=3021720 RepID=UPI00232B5D6F|nr:hypothetical protein [Oscillatoria sp. CS-180]MDB9527437.1 hypothetical protein [Oscillatoria sp. CS-180]
MITQLNSMLRRPLSILGGMAMLLGASSALAQSANFEGITLSAYPPAGASVDGSIVGSFSLSSIANSDSQGNLCAGFADTNPDHILTLESDFPTLTVTVDSGEDTTLLIQGPTDNAIRCGQDISRSNMDARISGQNWPAGTYRVWVGAHNQGQRFNYTLTVEE